MWVPWKYWGISNISAFLKCPRTINKYRCDKRLLLQLGFIKWAKQHTSHKKVSSHQELNSIDSSWVSKPSVDTLYHFSSAIPKHISILLNRYGRLKNEPKLLRILQFFFNFNQFDNCPLFLLNYFKTLFSCLASKSS